MPPVRRVGFLGRRRECRRLDAMLAQARDGHSAVLVISGEPGIGKTSLLRYAARQASGLRVVEVIGVQAEMELPLSGIQRLWAPLLGALDELPEPQQNALRVASGTVAGGAPDRFLVAVAVLNLLAATAAQRPVLCLVDDAQWLDATSLGALGFVARRLSADAVAMIFALREPTTLRALDGLPRMALGGLEDADARALLSRAVPGRLDDRVRDRIIGETRGNPLALLELSQGMSRSERAGGFPPPRAADLAGQVEERYLRRVTRLPEPTQRLILLAAAEPLGDAALLWRAADRLSLDQGALAPAADDGLLEIDDHVRFHHPLVRSAVYRAASPAERRRVHDALGQASDPALAADSRAWHRGLAAAEPDESVAADLERSAGRAQDRGGLAAAAAFLERATVLTPTRRSRPSAHWLPPRPASRPESSQRHSASWRWRTAEPSTASSRPGLRSCEVTPPSCPATATKRPRCCATPPNSSSPSTSLWLAGPTSPRGAPRLPRTTSAERRSFLRYPARSEPSRRCRPTRIPST